MNAIVPSFFFFKKKKDLFILNGFFFLSLFAYTAGYSHARNTTLICLVKKPINFNEEGCGIAEKEAAFGSN